ncbi:MAG: LacI family transcriptional regulator, partial [Lentisphaerae bacterium]|nr:LacI family transcriptional regulator [Lentisphaerota bacterium]
FASGMTPDAIVCGNDEEAAVLMPTLVALGKRIPDDVAVVGFDDVLCAQLCIPNLTTIHQPVELIAEAALGFLVSRIADAAMPAREVTIDAPLIRRGSTEKVV